MDDLEPRLWRTGVLSTITAMLVLVWMLPSGRATWAAPRSNNLATGTIRIGDWQFPYTNPVQGYALVLQSLDSLIWAPLIGWDDRSQPFGMLAETVPTLANRGVSRSGLIINVVAWAFGAYLGNVYYDTAKSAIVRMSFGMAHELRPHGISAVALAPGFMRTERVMVAPAADSNMLAKSGMVLTVGDLACEYGFTDVDGTQPEAFRLDTEAERP